VPFHESLYRLPVVAFAAREWKQADVTGAFDSSRKYTLVFCACTGLAARANLAFFGYQAAQYIRLFVIDRQVLVSTELADFGAGIITALTALVHIIIISRFSFHKN
jgi:hypothetical protein